MEFSNFNNNCTLNRLTWELGKTIPYQRLGNAGFCFYLVNADDRN